MLTCHSLLLLASAAAAPGADGSGEPSTMHLMPPTNVDKPRFEAPMHPLRHDPSPGLDPSCQKDPRSYLPTQSVPSPWRACTNLHPRNCLSLHLWAHGSATTFQPFDCGRNRCLSAFLAVSPCTLHLRTAPPSPFLLASVHLLPPLCHACGCREGPEPADGSLNGLMRCCP